MLPYFKNCAVHLYSENRVNTLIINEVLIPLFETSHFVICQKSPYVSIDNQHSKDF